MIPIIRQHLPMKDKSINPEYLSGFVDGEGSFVVSIFPRKRCPSGLEVLPSFSVSQSEKRSRILFLIKRYFNCGTIRSGGDGTLKYETRSVKDLLGKVIPHFKRYPLISGKRRDFEIFEQICQMIDKRLHRSKNGLKGIINLAFRMNPSGSRKYTKKYLSSQMKI